jgi:hypothetical protein
VKLERAPLALGAAKSKRIDAPHIVLAISNALSRNESPMLAVPAGDAQRQMGFPNVVEVGRWRDHLHLALTDHIGIDGNKMRTNT